MKELKSKNKFSLWKEPHWEGYLMVILFLSPVWVSNLKSIRWIEWYPYVSLFPDLLCNIGLSVSGVRQMRFNAYTPRRISTKNQFPKKPGFPLSALIILDWYPYVSLFPDLLCNIGLSVSGLRKVRFNAYTPRRISTKKISSQRNQDSRCPC